MHFKHFNILSADNLKIDLWQNEWMFNDTPTQK